MSTKAEETRCWRLVCKQNSPNLRFTSFCLPKRQMNLLEAQGKHGVVTLSAIILRCELLHLFKLHLYRPPERSYRNSHCANWIKVFVDVQLSLQKKETSGQR